MKILHTMLRVKNLNSSLAFWKLLGLQELQRKEGSDYTIVFLGDHTSNTLDGHRLNPCIELTYNHDERDYSQGDYFGHIAIEVEHIYQLCDKLEENNIIILRPPRDGKMAFVKSPDGHSVEILQQHSPLEYNSKWDRESNGTW